MVLGAEMPVGNWQFWENFRLLVAKFEMPTGYGQKTANTTRIAPKKLVVDR
jgi:hypothetical protein